MEEREEKRISLKSLINKYYGVKKTVLNRTILFYVHKREWPRRFWIKLLLIFPLLIFAVITFLAFIYGLYGFLGDNLIYLQKTPWYKILLVPVVVLWNTVKLLPIYGIILTLWISELVFSLFLKFMSEHSSSSFSVFVATIVSCTVSVFLSTLFFWVLTGDMNANYFTMISFFAFILNLIILKFVWEPFIIKSFARAYPEVYDEIMEEVKYELTGE